MCHFPICICIWGNDTIMLLGNNLALGFSGKCLSYVIQTMKGRHR